MKISSQRNKGTWSFDGNGSFRLFLDRSETFPVFSPLTWVYYGVTGKRVNLTIDRALLVAKELGLSKSVAEKIIRAEDTPASNLSKKERDLRYEIQEILRIPNMIMK